MSDASSGSDADFTATVAPYRAELRAHCYRMLGSYADAEDALQDALLGAWRGLGGFAGRASLRTWLYKIATNACLQLIAQRPKRLLSADLHPAARPDLAPDDAAFSPQLEPVWLEPHLDDPHATFEQRETVELAFVAALQHLPGTQRAALLLTEVLGFAAGEVAELLDTSVAAVNSALQRARATLEQRGPQVSQQATLRNLGEARQRELVAAFVAAWDRADVAALRDMLAEDARFTMPPLPSWFDGREDVVRFLRDRVFATPWRAVPLATTVSGQLAFACYQCRQPPAFDLGALCVLSLRPDGVIAQMTGFLDPALHRRFSLPER